MLASVAAVAVVTAAIALLDDWVPVLSLGVLYLFAVLPIAVVWGLAYAVAVSVGEHARVQLLLPRAGAHAHARRLAELARARRVRRDGGRRQRARRALAAAGARGVAARRDRDLAARARHGRRGARADLGRGGARAPGRPRADRARRGRRRAASRSRPAAGGSGRSSSRASAAASASARRRLLPALASLLGVAIDRERLAREALEAEALRRADVMKTALLRAVSHDLRTPLMAISTSAGALARPDLALDDADREELLATLLAASERLDHLVGNLLDLSRLQAGAAQPERGARRGRGARASRRSTSSARPAARVEVAFADEPPRCVVDAHQIRRVLVNLLENALKYSPGRRAGARAGVGRAVRGARARDRPRARASRRRSASGSSSRSTAAPRGGDAPGAGLGLAIARGFAEANGGRLTVESRLGQGATFVLALPAVRAPGRRHERPAARARRRRRAADPARAADEPARRRLRGRDRRDRRGRARRGGDAPARGGDPRPRPARRHRASTSAASCGRGARRR